MPKTKPITRSEWDALWELLGDDNFYMECEDEDLPHEGEMFRDGVLTFDLGELAPIWQGSHGRVDDPDVAERIVKRTGGLITKTDCNRGYLPSFKALIERMRKRGTTETIVVEVAKDKAKAVREAIKKAGGKVL